ncbi:Hypothetical_protein [Hexamita inflata]|uniref:Hypothetical_protein n=1 Tax=Hexamita inflata TaxID=28002 RepID=A0AA86R4C7_9EUKA|nr:Hypothetical protein HINF_LOCUS57920 [Hexamita inflata]
MEALTAETLAARFPVRSSTLELRRLTSACTWVFKSSRVELTAVALESRCWSMSLMFPLNLVMFSARALSISRTEALTAVMLAQILETPSVRFWVSSAIRRYSAVALSEMLLSNADVFSSRVCSKNALLETIWELMSASALSSLELRAVEFRARWLSDRSCEASSSARMLVVLPAILLSISCSLSSMAAF